LKRRSRLRWFKGVKTRMVSDGTAPYHAVYSNHERHSTMNPSFLLPTTLIEQFKEAMKMLASVPKFKIDKPVLYSNLLDLVG
jgi:hypothetical protein